MRCTIAASDDYLLLLEHPHVYTLGRGADLGARARAPGVGRRRARARATAAATSPIHGPGQLVGYPIVTLPEWRDGQRDVVAYVRALEEALIDALAELRSSPVP